MPWLMPHLTVSDVPAAIAWYKQAFGMTVRLMLPDENPIHAELNWQNMVIMLGQAGTGGCMTQPPAVTGVACPMGLYLYCEDVDAMYQRVREVKGKVQSEPTDMFWGDRLFTVKDPDGHEWTFATQVGEFDPSKLPTAGEMADAPPPPRAHRSVTVQTLPDLRVIYDRHVGVYAPENLGPFFRQVMDKVGQHQLMGPQSMVLGICQDDPREVPEDQCRYDAGVTADASTPCPAGMSEQILPGGDYAVILHKGPYDNLADTWQWIGQIAFPNLGRACREQPPFERYLNSPSDTAPDDLLTEIYIPLDDGL